MHRRWAAQTHDDRGLNLGIRFLDPSGQSCPTAFSATMHHRHNSNNNNNMIKGKLDNEVRMIELATGCNVVTMEIKHVGVAGLRKLKERGVAVRPWNKVVAVVHDKYFQKVLMFV